MTTILILNYDDSTTRKLQACLRLGKYRVTVSNAYDKMSVDIKTQPLVILDARMKWTTCRPLFEQFQRQGCPVLFVTSDRNMVGHLRALYTGSSDVLTLPFLPKALLSKVTRLLDTRQELRKLTVNEQERVVMLDGQRVELTAQEYALLFVLMENPDTALSREHLLRQAWGYQSMGETRTVDVHVQRLRKKLGDDRIETVYKCGYRLKMA